MIKLDIPVEAKYVVAFSGGADSALLAYLLRQQKFDFRLVHVIHSDSKASKDGESIAEFCQTWADTYDVAIEFACVKPSFDTTKAKGVEAAERDARYSALFSALKPDEILLTGHHLDDSLETMLFRLARGTSVKGMSGIQKISPDSRLIRPLLSISKSEIQLSVEAAAILYGHDSTNDDTELSRGFIRNKIIPLFVEHFSREKFYSSAKRAMENFSECSALMEDLFNMDTQICGSNATGIHRVIFASLSEQRQRNFIYHLVAKETKKFLTRSAIEEIRKRLNSNRKQLSFVVSGITVTLHQQYFYIKNGTNEVNIGWTQK